MTREQLFDQWMTLKTDIQSLAGIVQNDITLSGEDLLNWLNQVDEFKIKLSNIQIKTVRQVKLNGERTT